MNYNTQLSHVIIPEYGRNLQKLIEYACTIKDKKERNEIANAIIAIMGRLNPHLRDITDYRHKLWDHLFIISDFKLDVDSPYPKLLKEILATRPERVKYPANDIHIKHYGKAVERLIAKAIEMKDGEEKTGFIHAIANLMKKCYLTWNRQSVDDNIILSEMEELSKGKLKVSEGFRMNSTYNILSMNQKYNERNSRDSRDGISSRENRNGREHDRDRGRGRDKDRRTDRRHGTGRHRRDR
ncbi:MAG: DUF4290 domain-containing protein [Bacteroidota bacterium]